MDLMNIVTAIRDGRINITRHASKAANDDGLGLQDILLSLTTGSVINHYPEDKPYPSCLILSWVDAATPIHSVWAYNAGMRSAVLITVYRPDPKQWTDWKRRTKP